MKTLSANEELDYSWVGITTTSGSAGIIAYTIIGTLGHSTSNLIAVPLTFIFAFGITVSGIGLYHILGGATGARMALIAAAANAIGAAQLLAMIMVQLSVRAVVDEPEVPLRAVWWGLDVAWDLYIGTGTILFAICMFGRRGLGTWLAIPGLSLGALLLIFNIATFPFPPANVGLVDVGPLVGLWYLVVYVRLGTSSLLLVRQQGRSTASLSS